MKKPDPDTNSPELRRRILEATRHLLVEHGYNNLSMRRIARSIGYSATTIYLYFDDKDHLFHALIDEGLEQLHEQLKQTYDAEPDAPMKRLESLCRSFIDFGISNPEYYEIMFLLDTANMERYPPEKYRRARRNLDLIAETLREANDQALLTLEDPRVIASTIWASLHGAISLVLSRRLDVRIETDAFMEATVQFAVHGVAADGITGAIPLHQKGVHS